MPTTVFDDSFDTTYTVHDTYWRGPWYTSNPSNVTTGGGVMNVVPYHDPTEGWWSSVLVTRDTPPPDRGDYLAWAAMPGGALATFDIGSLGTAGTELGGPATYFRLTFAGGDELEFEVSADGLAAYYYDYDGDYTRIGGPIPFDGTGWLRLAITPDRSLAKWQTSPNGTAWATRFSMPAAEIQYADTLYPTQPTVYTTVSYRNNDGAPLVLNRAALVTYAPGDPDPTGEDIGATRPAHTSLSLRARIYDLQGNHLVTLHQHEGIEVTWPLADARLASVIVSIYDPSLRHVSPLDRVLAIEYGPHLLFKGYIVNPVWNASGKTVQINAHDATLKLKHCYHRYGDPVVDTGYPYDGVGFRLLVQSSQPSVEQLARGVIGNGITDGQDSVPEQGPKPSRDEANDPGAPLWSKVARGSNVWESLVELTQSVIGFEFDFEPVDEAHPPTTGSYEPGTLAQLNTHPRLGTDRADTVQFHYGFGADNAEDFTYEPDGGVVRNYWVEVNPDGERHNADSRNKALVHDEGSWRRYGIYQGWESAGQKWPKAVLVERARYWVEAYAYSPDFFSVDPKPDTPGVPLLLTDYRVGDVIRAAARIGMLDIELTGRVIEAQITQRSPSGGANVSLTCVPDLDTAPVEGT